MIMIAVISVAVKCMNAKSRAARAPSSCTVYVARDLLVLINLLSFSYDLSHRL